MWNRNDKKKKNKNINLNKFQTLKSRGILLKKKNCSIMNLLFSLYISQYIFPYQMMSKIKILFSDTPTVAPKYIQIVCNPSLYLNKWKCKSEVIKNWKKMQENKKLLNIEKHV